MKDLRILTVLQFKYMLSFLFCQRGYENVDKVFEKIYQNALLKPKFSYIIYLYVFV